jgi:UDP-glucose 4-epimerase
VDVIIRLMEYPKAVGEVFNIGSQEEVSVEDLAKKVIELTKSKSRITYIPYNEAYEEGFEDMQRRVPDISKVKSFIGFRPTIDLKGILEDIIGFYKDKPPEMRKVQ